VAPVCALEFGAPLCGPAAPAPWLVVLAATEVEPPGVHPPITPMVPGGHTLIGFGCSNTAAVSVTSKVSTGGASCTPCASCTSVPEVKGPDSDVSACADDAVKQTRPIRLVAMMLANLPGLPCALVFMLFTPCATAGLGPCCLVRSRPFLLLALRFSDKHAITLRALTGEASCSSQELNRWMKDGKTFQS
jgi:hypothetical protein